MEFSWLYIWLIIAVVTLVFELITVGLTSIWLTGGALVALLASALHAPVWLQVTLFFVVSFILIFITRPWAVKYFNNRKMKTNYEEAIGSEVRVIERVDNRKETGKAVFHGMEWTARARFNDIIFEPEEIAVVTEVSGVKLILEKPVMQKVEEEDSDSDGIKEEKPDSEGEPVPV